MAKEALESKLREIDMSEGENESYDQFLQAVARDIAQLRVILEGVNFK